MKKAKLTIDKGVTLSLTFTFRAEDGDAADFSTLASATFRVTSSTDTLLELTGTVTYEAPTAEDPGTATVAFSATNEQTDALEFATAAWCVLLTYEDATVLKPVGGTCYLDAEDR